MSIVTTALVAISLLKLLLRLLLTCVSDYTDSMSNPDEDRLLIELFDPEYQKNNLQTYPVTSVQEVMNVTVAIYIVKLVSVVGLKIVFFLNSF